MASKRRFAYKWKDGVLGVPRTVIRSEAYLDMSLPARQLMLHLQDAWKDHEPIIHYSVRRAAKIIGVGVGTATKAFKELEEHGFIRMTEESNWLNGKAREWRLTWLTSHKREPTNEWEAWEITDPAFSQRYGQPPNRSASDTVTLKPPKPPTKNQQLRVVSNA